MMAGPEDHAGEDAGAGIRRPAGRSPAVDLTPAIAAVRQASTTEHLALAAHGAAQLLTALRLSAQTHKLDVPTEVAEASRALTSWALELSFVDELPGDGGGEGPPGS